MALSVDQALAIAWPSAIADGKRPFNQWSEQALLREMDKQGMIKRMNLGESISVQIDHQANPEAKVMTADDAAVFTTSVAKTEVISEAQYDIAEIVSPLAWSEKDENSASGEQAKVSFIASLIDNGNESHNAVLEAGLFATDGTLLGFDDLIDSTDGGGTVGGINASVDVMWKNQVGDPYTDGDDVEAAMTAVFLACAKGSGSDSAPTLIATGVDGYATYEGALQAFQRFQGGDKASGGFGAVLFKMVPVIYSQYADDASAFIFLNKKAYSVYVQKSAYRKLRPATYDQNSLMTVRHVYSALQAIVTTRSRLGVLTITG